MSTLSENTGPVEVFLTKKNIVVAGRIYAEDEECLYDQEMDSVSMRGAQREMTSFLISRGYEPAGRWEWVTGEEFGEDIDRGETVRVFRRKKA